MPVSSNLSCAANCSIAVPSTSVKSSTIFGFPASFACGRADLRFATAALYSSRFLVKRGKLIVPGAGAGAGRESCAGLFGVVEVKDVRVVVMDF
ncbi:hypothetical protein D3C71_2030160 [compost metagenome]